MCERQLQNTISPQENDTDANAASCCIEKGGQYVLDIMDTYGASISVLIIAIMEMTFIMWGYGVNNFCKDVHAMLDFTPSIYFKVFIHTTDNAIDCFSFPGMLGFFLASNPCRYFHCCGSKLAETQLWRSPISRCTVLS